MKRDRGRPRIFTDRQRKVRRVHNNVWHRCCYPKTNGYERYGAKGIQCSISVEELEEIWVRDKADDMQQPSIDRINHDAHYTKENCRFIELSEHRKQYRLKICTQCNSQTLRLSSKHSECFKCRHPPSCNKCGQTYVRTMTGKHYCPKCYFVTKECVRCGKPITRPNVKGFRRFPRWACCGIRGKGKKTIALQAAEA